LNFRPKDDRGLGKTANISNMADRDQHLFYMLVTQGSLEFFIADYSKYHPTLQQKDNSLAPYIYLAHLNTSSAERTDIFYMKSNRKPVQHINTVKERNVLVNKCFLL